jgi:hypothetical protein
MVNLWAVGHAELAKPVTPEFVRPYHAARFLPDFYQSQTRSTAFTGFERGGELIDSCLNITERVMLARKAMNMQIEAVHSRAICEEIGDRLREILRREASSELPPRLQHLMERLAEADRETAPSLVPSLEDMIQQQPIDPRHQSTAYENSDAQFA